MGVPVGSHIPEEGTKITHDSSTSAYVLAVSPKPTKDLPSTSLGLGCSVSLHLKFRAELLGIVTKYIGISPQFDTLTVEFALPEHRSLPMLYLLSRNSELGTFTRFYGYEDIELFGNSRRVLGKNVKNLSSENSSYSSQYTVITDHVSFHTNPPIHVDFLADLLSHPDLVRHGIILQFIYISDQSRNPLPIESASGVIRFKFQLPDYSAYNRDTAPVLRRLLTLIIGVIFPQVMKFSLSQKESDEGIKIREAERSRSEIGDKQIELKKKKMMEIQQKEEKKYLAEKQRREKARTKNVRRP